MLNHVQTGGPHALAHNAERDYANSLFSRRRVQFPLTTEGTLTQSASGDATLTKGYVVDGSDLTNASYTVATQAKLDAFPVDLGTPSFLKVLYRADPYTFIWNFPTKDGTFGGNPANTMAEYRFMTNAPKVQLCLYRAQGTANGHQVYINGLPLQARPNVGVSAIDNVTITFPDSQSREIMLRTAALFGGIGLAAPYEVWRPESRRGLSIYTIGDSWSAPIVYADDGSSQGIWDEGLANGIEDWTGFRDHYIDAIGGTGWVQRNSGGFLGPNNNYSDRWSQVLRANPDVFFVPNGCCNDAYNNLDQNTVANTIKSCFQSLRDQNPNTKIIYADGFKPPYSGFANNLTYYAAIRALLIPMLASIGVYYIDTISAPWIAGTGIITAKTGTGNSDLYVGADGSHLSGTGYRYLKTRFVPKLQRVLSDSTNALVNQVI